MSASFQFQHFVSANKLPDSLFEVWEIPAYPINMQAADLHDGYVICLINGSATATSIPSRQKAEGLLLVLSNPDHIAAWDIIATRGGYICRFKRSLLSAHHLPQCLGSSPLFTGERNPILPISPFQHKALENIFQQLIKNQYSTYRYKLGYIRNCIEIILHESIRFRLPGYKLEQ